MSDERIPDQARDRAEDALARALNDHADDHDFAPLDPAALTTRTTEAGRRRRPWLVAVAAVLAVAVGIPLVGVLIPRAGQPGVIGTPAPSSTPEPSENPPSGAIPAPRAGWRWESMLNVIVQVPESWGYGFAPGKDWCVEGAGRPYSYLPPSTPFVDHGPASRVVLTLLCLGEMPDSLRQTHLSWRRATPEDADGEERVGAEPAQGWIRVNRVAGAAFLTVEAPADQADLAREILATARVVDVDPRGCPVRLPEGRPTQGSITDFSAASAATVCGYYVLGQGGPDLTGSYSLVGEEADALLGAVLDAQIWTDVVGENLDCRPEGDVFMMRFTDAAGAVRVVLLPTGLGDCRFALNDGVGFRAPTRATCADLLVGPLTQAGFLGEEISNACAPRPS
ncbi:MAG: hypothetical protein QM708_01340 [Propioniciclava sp.]|uniref:hypothetical protein n=1 Tax=Propioniciclava sp. TaxID=2038686 RepID=UPI0039E6016F